jgi:hypothetical protein
MSPQSLGEGDGFGPWPEMADRGRAHAIKEAACVVWHPVGSEWWPAWPELTPFNDDT